MAHRLAFDDKSWALTSYIIVHPFTFDSQGNFVSQALLARAFFSMITTQIQEGSGGHPRQSTNLILTGNFDLKVTDKRDSTTTIATLQDFDVRAVNTPASLDMSRAVIGLRAVRSVNTSIGVSPRHRKFAEFAQTWGTNKYWGATLKDEDDILRASLSVPTYKWQKRHLAEYFALGPANGHDSSGQSIFEWLTSHGAPPIRDDQYGGVIASSADPLPALTIEDHIHGTKNTLFGADPAGVSQVSSASGTATGAVFLTSGSFADMKWRELEQFVRAVATREPGDENMIDLMHSFPITRLDQSVRETARPALDLAGSYSDDVRDFEGIAVWGLNPRDGEPEIDPLHR